MSASSRPRGRQRTAGSCATRWRWLSVVCFSPLGGRCAAATSCCAPESGPRLLGASSCPGHAVTNLVGADSAWNLLSFSALAPAVLVWMLRKGPGLKVASGAALGFGSESLRQLEQRYDPLHHGDLWSQRPPLDADQHGSRPRTGRWQRLLGRQAPAVIFTKSPRRVRRGDFFLPTKRIR